YLWAGNRGGGGRSPQQKRDSLGGQEPTYLPFLDAHLTQANDLAADCRIVIARSRREVVYEHHASCYQCTCVETFARHAGALPGSPPIDRVGCRLCCLRRWLNRTE